MGRQNWRAPATSTFSIPASCQPYVLPSGLLIPLEPPAPASATPDVDPASTPTPTSTLTLTTPLTVTPACFLTLNLPTATISDSDSPTIVLTSELRDPFYASSIPMAYSISATTIVAYILLLLLFLPSPPATRPYLQKLATLSVCVCLTLAFTATTAVLKAEYDKSGSSLYTISNESRLVRDHVISGLPLKIGRVISNLFLWLAQTQTLIRLFPREREKAVIKWTGFVLILLDTLFSILQSFVSPLAAPDSPLDAIPALSYLFQISLSLLYAVCVLYYGFAQRRFAWDPRKPGLFLIAVLSVVAVLTPLVFFIVDIAQKDLAGWGDYVRWVGAAAASVVVWEWVDRIERGIREDGKEGVLGREVFEEDEIGGSEGETVVRSSCDEDAGSRPPGSDGGDGGSVVRRVVASARASEVDLEKQERPKAKGLPVVVVPPPPRGRRGDWQRSMSAGPVLPSMVPLPESRSGTTRTGSVGTRES